jgi:hypothetical protein
MKTRNFVTLYKFLIHLGMHHTSRGNDDSDGSGKATKTTAAAAMAGGEIQQSTKKGMTKRAMATEMATVTDSDNNNVDANANDSALMTETRRTGPGCALR